MRTSLLLASLLSLLTLACAAHQTAPARFTPEVESAMVQSFSHGCISPDQAWIAYRDRAEQIVVLSARTGEERWQGAGKLVYCNDLGVITAKPVSMETTAAIEVQFRSYDGGQVLAKGQAEIAGCGDQTYSPWPQEAFVGLQWNTRPVWEAAYPPGPDFDEEVKRCSASGAIWVHRDTSAVKSATISASEVPSEKFQLDEKMRASIGTALAARALQVAIESTPVLGEQDGCGQPLRTLQLVARNAGTVIWTRPYGQSESECRP